MTRWPYAAAAALALGACAPRMVKVDTGELTINGAMSVTLTQSWNRFDAQGVPVRVTPMGAHELWTSDGLPLDVLAFFVGVEDGQRLGASVREGRSALPPFRAAMSPHEVVDLYEALLTQDGSSFTLLRLGPARIGNAPGFRFEHVLTRRADGLRLAGVGYGAIVSDRLYLMTYTAPSLRFYARQAVAVETVAMTARIEAPPAPALAGAPPVPPVAGAPPSPAARQPDPLFGPDARRFERGHDSGGNVRFESESKDGKCSSWAACGNREPREANRPTTR